MRNVHRFLKVNYPTFYLTGLIRFAAAILMMFTTLHCCIFGDDVTIIGFVRLQMFFNCSNVWIFLRRCTLRLEYTQLSVQITAFDGTQLLYFLMIFFRLFSIWNEIFLHIFSVFFKKEKKFCAFFCLITLSMQSRMIRKAIFFAQFQLKFLIFPELSNIKKPSMICRARLRMSLVLHYYQ